MPEEQLTPEETAAMEAMEADKGEPVEAEDAPADDGQEAAEPEQGEAETKAEPEGEKPADKQAADKPPEGYVPHQAMHAERTKRQALEKRLAELEAQITKPEQEKEAPPEFVDPLENPEGFRKYQEYQNKTLQQRIDEQQQAQQRQMQERQVMADVQRSEQEFAEKKADYPQAFDHLYTTRFNELRGMGYDDTEAQNVMRQDAQAIYSAAKQMGMNPAEVVYMRAQSLGYQPQAQQQQPAPRNNDNADKVNALSKAQDATSGISGSGEPQEGQLTVAKMAQMSEEELAKVPEDQFKRLMGG